MYMKENVLCNKGKNIVSEISTESAPRRVSSK